MRARVEALLEAWRAEISADPKLTTPGSLPRAQLLDHLPLWLDTLATAMAAEPGRAAAQRAHDEETHNAQAHGLQRWQQGYDLQEVTREWAALNRCLVAELDRFFAGHPTSREVQAGARATLALFAGEATSESAAQYFRLERLEAAGTVSDLEQALDDIRAMEKSRAALWQEAAHDLRGNLGVVSNVAVGLGIDDLPPERRTGFMGMLRNNLGALHRLLDDVTDLARLHAGQERLRGSRFDAAQLLAKLCADLRPVADGKGLALTVIGSGTLMVEGDEIKVRRIAQNLLLNAMKYTVDGRCGGRLGRHGGTRRRPLVVQRRRHRPRLPCRPRRPGGGGARHHARRGTRGRRRAPGAPVARRGPRPGDRQAPVRAVVGEHGARVGARQGHDRPGAPAEAIPRRRRLVRGGNCVTEPVSVMHLDAFALPAFTPMRAALHQALL